MRLNKKKVSFLISGKGSNLYKILVNNFKNEKFFVVSIISNNLISDEIKKIVKRNEYKINLIERVANLKSYYFKNTDIIFSVGYMKVINSKLINKYNIGHTTANTHPGGRNLTLALASRPGLQKADTVYPLIIGNNK